MDMLDGWKTYIVAATMVVLVVMEKFLGIDIPGFEVQGDWMAWLLGALGLGALRSGVAKK